MTISNIGRQVNINAADCQIAPYHVLDYLNSQEDIDAYLQAAIDTGDKKLIAAVRHDIALAAQKLAAQKHAPVFLKPRFATY